LGNGKSRTASAAGGRNRQLIAPRRRDRDLGHLKRNETPVADHLGADLDQLLAQPVSDHGSAVVGIASVRMKLPRL
jgi:hypothetical protein